MKIGEEQRLKRGRKKVRGGWKEEKRRGIEEEEDPTKGVDGERRGMVVIIKKKAD